jgi:excisionase family DNA binding protein
MSIAMTEERPFVSPEELANRWGMNKKTVYSAIREGHVPITRVGRRILIATAWVELQENPTHDD